MKRIVTAGVLVLGLAVIACGRDSPSEEHEYPTTFNDDGSAVQQRVSAHVSEAVVPRLRECWQGLTGDGLVALDISYGKSSGSWTFEKVAVKKSTLADPQEAAALRCAEEAVQAAAFPVAADEPVEEAAETFVVRLGVPVPLPADDAEVGSDAMARMVGTSDGGSADIPGCSACVSNPSYPYGLKCESKSSGGHLDCREHSSNVCSTAPTACLRGFFAGTRGVVMY